MQTFRSISPKLCLRHLGCEYHYRKMKDDSDVITLYNTFIDSELDIENLKILKEQVLPECFH